MIAHKSIFMTVSLKSLSGNFNILGIPILTSTDYRHCHIFRMTILTIEKLTENVLPLGLVNFSVGFFFFLNWEAFHNKVFFVVVFLTEIFLIPSMANDFYMT